MYHTLALSESIATATLTDLDVVQDQILQATNGHFMPPNDMFLYAGRAMATNLQRVRLTTPRVRQISPIFLRPLRNTLIGGDDANDLNFSRAPLRLSREEEIVVEALQNAGANQRVTVILFVGDRLRPVPAGEVFPIRATSTTAVTANVWSQLVFTLDSQLPAGRYAVVLIEHVSANGQVVRAIFDQQFYRPGAPSIIADTNRLGYHWYDYFMGVWGEFNTYSLPRIEVLCNAADAVHDLIFHVVPLPGSPRGLAQ